MARRGVLSPRNYAQSVRAPAVSQPQSEATAGRCRAEGPGTLGLWFPGPCIAGRLGFQRQPGEQVPQPELASGAAASSRAAFLKLGRKIKIR